MGKGRFEAFSDGVIAVIITIMVLEMKVPHGESIEALSPVLPVFLSYVLSFIYVGSIGTTIITCCTHVPWSPDPCSGPTFICCSGCR
jgi:hypothetical protein